MFFTDTERIVYEIETDDVYEDFYEDRCLFDFSNYPKDLRFYYPVNKKVIGRIKDEVRGKLLMSLLD